eukprot:m.242255 g.242255  ORF g.242255 m.242255 type:complete len:172 (+) comp19006_c6_seq6:298-813(+)
MDSGSLSTALDAVASTGFVLSVEQRSALQSSLLLLRQAEKFTRVVLFGRITAVSRDYLVAQGFAAADPLVPAKSFYSTDGVTWAQLPEVHPMLAATCNRINNRFTGNPSHEYTVTEPAPPPGTDIPADVRQGRKPVQGSRLQRGYLWLSVWVCVVFWVSFRDFFFFFECRC